MVRVLGAAFLGLTEFEMNILSGCRKVCNVLGLEDIRDYFCVYEETNAI